MIPKPIVKLDFFWIIKRERYENDGHEKFGKGKKDNTHIKIGEQ